MPVTQAWLDQVQEEILEPELPICDPHHHLWDHSGSRYLLDELMADTNSGHHVVKTVFVECAVMYRASGPEAMQPIGETEFVQGIAAQSASGQYGETRAVDGIVSFADLCLGDAVKPVLEAHIDAARNRFRGIRHTAGWDADAGVRNSHTNPTQGLLMDATFRRGFACLQPLGLSFDAWLYHPQLDDLVDLARAFPDTSIILDHVGGPLGIGPYEGQRDAVAAQWRNSMSELAQCPNVVVKVGGMTMAICGFGWHKQARPPGSVELAEALKPYYHFCIEQFGVERCMFESNFPVDKLSCSYPILWNMFKRLAAGFSADEKRWLFHDAAVQAYRLA